MRAESRNSCGSPSADFSTTSTTLPSKDSIVWRSVDQLVRSEAVLWNPFRCLRTEETDEVGLVGHVEHEAHMVTRKTSSTVVTPVRTFSKPSRRREITLR